MKCRYCDGTGTSNTCVNGTFKPCAACDGTGEEIPDDEVMYITDTNFDRITASPEALAEFISILLHDGVCDVVNDCNVCPWVNEDCTNSDTTESDMWLKWLKQESK